MESSKNDQNVPAIDIPIWQYDEMKHPGEDFDAEAGVYDERQLKTRDVKGEINECLDLLNLQPDQTVLDMGTGTGEFAIAAAGYCSKVFAVDLSPGMLKIADAKARIKGIKNIEFVQAGFLTYEHSGEPVDVAVSQFTLHYLPDFWKQIALLRLSRMMKKGAKLLLEDTAYAFDIAKYEEIFNQGTSHIINTMGKDDATAIISHIRDEYCTIDWILEGLIRRAGFTIERSDYKKMGMQTAYLCTKVA
jgi:ubiquinone/menaquinone biosynthesis C-methylase UbiE